MITLKGSAVKSQINVFKSPNKDTNGKDVWIGSHDGKGFTIPEEVVVDWKAGNIAELTLVDGEYIAKKANDARKIKVGDTVKCYSIGGYLPYNMAINMAQNELKLSRATKELLATAEIVVDDVEQLIS